MGSLTSFRFSLSQTLRGGNSGHGSWTWSAGVILEPQAEVVFLKRSSSVNNSNRVVVMCIARQLVCGFYVGCLFV